MSIRFIICIIITFICAVVFLFAPQFNIGATAHISIFDQYLKNGFLWETIKRVGGLTLVIFIALYVILVAGKQVDKKEEPEEK